MTFAALWGDGAKETLLLVSVYFFRKNWGWPKVPSAAPSTPPPPSDLEMTKQDLNIIAISFVSQGMHLLVFAIPVLFLLQK